MRSFTAGPNDAGVRLSRFVQRVTLGLPEAAMHKGFRNRRIKVNGSRAQPQYRLAAGDIVELYLNDDFFSAADAPGIVGDGPLPDYGTEYRNGHIAVLYKPAGVSSHRDARGRPGLLEAFTTQLAAEGTYRPGIDHAFAPALCNRLDRGTEGLVLAAISSAGLRDTAALLRDNLVEKTYLCICVGTPPQGTFNAHLARSRAEKIVTVSDASAPGSKSITTGVQVLESHNSLTLCQITLHTGRTHQIRAHLAHLGTPILGDRKYGGPAPGLKPPPYPALCAWRLVFAPQLPKGNVLAPLAGQTFTATQAGLPHQWQALGGSAMGTG